MKKITIAVIVVLIFLANSYAGQILSGEKQNLITPNVLMMVLQVVNFLILVWVLDKFLFGPVVSIMEKREGIIRNNYAKAENDKEEASKLVEEHRAELLKLKQEQKKVLSDALHEGDDLKRKMLEETKTELDELRKENIAELDREKEKAFNEIKKEFGGIVIQLAETVLRKKVDKEVNDAYVNDLLKQIERK